MEEIAREAILGLVKLDLEAGGWMPLVVLLMRSIELFDGDVELFSLITRRGTAAQEKDDTPPLARKAEERGAVHVVVADA